LFIGNVERRPVAATEQRIGGDQSTGYPDIVVGSKIGPKSSSLFLRGNSLFFGKIPVMAAKIPCSVA
jgi:hypothetical protein